MKSSDVVPMPNTARNFLAESLCDRNASHVHSFPHWRETVISATRGGIESSTRGFARDAAIAGFDRRKRLHTMLDAALSEVGYEEGPETQQMHAALDRRLDAEEEPSESEEPEEELDEEDPDWPDNEEERASEQKAVDALCWQILKKINGETAAKPRHVAKRHSGYICDSDYIAKYLNPNLSCIEAENRLRPRVMKEQESNANRGYWSGLFYFLHSQPDGSRVKDCQPATLSMLISRTLAA